MKISILHPSRSRPEQAMAAYKNWVGNCSKKKYDIEYILSLDGDDPTWVSYIWANGLHILYNDNKNVVQAANHAAKAATGDILVLISDDFECFPEWDQVVVKALEGKSGVLKTFDGVQPWIVTLPIMTRDYYLEQGYLYDPLVHHMFCDTIMTHKADLQKKLIIRNDIRFEHKHYSTGAVKKDAVNIKADSTWNQGESVYIQRCRERFGLGKGTNVYDLSPEAKAAGHIQWMKKKHIR